MTLSQPRDSSRPRQLRLWPGIAIAVLLVLVRYVLPRLAPEAEVGKFPIFVVAMMGGLALGACIVLWWLLASRARWFERLGAIGLMAAGYFAVRPLLDESLGGTTMMGKMLFIFVIPTLALALVAGATLARNLAPGPRRAVIAGAILLAAGSWALLRTGGITGDSQRTFHWRWSKSAEDRLAENALSALPSAAPARAQAPTAAGQVELAPVAAAEEPAAVPSPSIAPAATDAPATAPASPAPATARAEIDADWPGFRGVRRDGIVRGVRIATDWSAAPPVELWRRPVGPGWSSFAVQGDLLYTQEQRGEDEVVACYRVSTGEPVWAYRDAVRFVESEGGAGPRGTPAVHGGLVYALGATGVLNALDARTGALVWKRNAGADTKTEVPGWGFSGSPLVLDDLLLVAAEGKLVAYELATGKPRWYGPDGKAGYSSPHVLTLAGERQVLLMSGAGATGVSLADGKQLWQHKLPSGARIVQPNVTADGDLLIADGDYGDGNHLRRVAVHRGASGWSTQEKWVSMGLKPNFNDFVVHRGHAYGFDGSILSAVDVADGKRKWKGGRYGNGQLVLLADQDLLLVLSEQGELALVAARPEQYTELARIPVIHGKTWNHPVLVGDVLLVRNAEEMAAFRLNREAQPAQSLAARSQ